MMNAIEEAPTLLAGKGSSMLDENNRLLAFNRCFLELLGFSTDRFKSRPILWSSSFATTQSAVSMEAATSMSW